MAERQNTEEPLRDDVDEDSLDFVLRKYHEHDDSGATESVLDALQHDIGELPRVLLQQAEGEEGLPGPPVTGSDEQILASRHRYQMFAAGQ